VNQINDETAKLPAESFTKIRKECPPSDKVDSEKFVNTVTLGLPSNEYPIQEKASLKLKVIWISDVE